MGKLYHFRVFILQNTSKFSDMEIHFSVSVILFQGFFCMICFSLPMAQCTRKLRKLFLLSANCGNSFYVYSKHLE